MKKRIKAIMATGQSLITVEPDLTAKSPCNAAASLKISDFVVRQVNLDIRLRGKISRNCRVGCIPEQKSAGFRPGRDKKTGTGFGISESFSGGGPGAGLQVEYNIHYTVNRAKMNGHFGPVNGHLTGKSGADNAGIKAENCSTSSQFS